MLIKKIKLLILPIVVTSTILFSTTASAATDPNYGKNLNIAIQAVISAETTKTDSDVIAADKAISLLPNGADKINLINRLNAIKNLLYINNLNAANVSVSIAEKALTEDSINEADKLIQKLPNGNDKTTLISRLLAAKELIKLNSANDAISIAESSLLDSDADRADKIISSLTTNQYKPNLLNRMNILRSKIYENKVLLCKSALSRAESLLTTDSINEADKLIKALPNGNDKDLLILKLTNLKNFIKIIDTVKVLTTAENSLSDSDINAADKAISSLPNTQLKDILAKRLTADKDRLYQNKVHAATIATNKAAALLTPEAFNEANKLINLLPMGNDKTYLSNLVKIIAANKALNDAEISFSDTDAANADKLIAQIADGQDKTNLSLRLKYVRLKIYQNKVLAATNSIVKAENSLTEDTVKDAEKLINALPSGNDKNLLTSRLLQVKYIISIKTANKLTSIAEVSYELKDYASALSAINSLNTKDKAGFLTRLDAIKLVIDAKNAVTDAENHPSVASYKQKAQNLVYLLPSSTIKDSLQVRINSIK